MNTNLGDTIIPACLDCPPSSDLCIHDQELLPLAEAIARHFDAENPDTGKFLVDADQLVDTIGPGPYTTRRLDVDYVADSDCPYAAGTVINGYVVAFPPCEHPADSAPVIIGRLVDANSEQGGNAT